MHKQLSQGAIAGLLVLLLAVAAVPRLYSALTLGWGWDGPDSFTLVNFDEGGSCRAALDGFEYSTFVGYQTIALASMVGDAPPADIRGDARAVRAYCHSPGHIRVARLYSALCGALTPLLLVCIGLALMPARPAVGLSAGALLALSGWHISLSQSATVDVPSVFFIYAFIALLVVALTRGPRWLWILSPVLLVPALWAKYWVFAVFAYVGLLPARFWDYIYRGWSAPRLSLAVAASCVLFACLSNVDFSLRAYPLLALFYLFIPWRRLAPGMRIPWLLLPLLCWAVLQVDIFAEFGRGSVGSRFGQGYALIGWHKWLRNLINLPLVLLVGLGLPALLCLPFGLRELLRRPQPLRGWLCLLPVLVFALFMLSLAVVTYYRHYLALLPAAALLAAMGYWAMPARWARLLLPAFLLWPALLALDLVGDYHRDPRIALRDWYAQMQPQRVLVSYYVNPPLMSGTQHQLFSPEQATGPQPLLHQAQYLVLSENWYDTAFANELNGPLVDDLQRLVKTRPEYARFYRRAVADRHPDLVLHRRLKVHNFMPELLWHKYWYGTFQMFVGDILIFRVRPGE